MRRLAIVLAAVLLTVAPAAQSQDTARAKVVLKGAGATFPAPLYQKWIQADRQVDPKVSISYDAVGSGEGQRRLYDRYGDRDKGAALRKFVTWGLSEGQTHSRALGYIPLPPEIATLSLAAVERVD